MYSPRRPHTSISYIKPPTFLDPQYTQQELAEDYSYHRRITWFTTVLGELFFVGGTYRKSQIGNNNYIQSAATNYKNKRKGEFIHSEIRILFLPIEKKGNRSAVNIDITTRYN